MKALRITALALLVLIGGGYLGRDGLVRVLDQRFLSVLRGWACSRQIVCR